jgi:hypothetical protein
MSEATNPIDEAGAKSWNECIKPRLESIRGWYTDGAWHSGVAPYLRNRLNLYVDQLVQGNSTRTHEQDRFMAGQIAMMKEILALPDMIDRAIDTIEKLKAQEKQRTESVGKAGY